MIDSQDIQEYGVTDKKFKARDLNENLMGKRDLLGVGEVVELKNC